jgi:hypothetical protein
MAISRAGESGGNPAAEGATAPETLRQKDRARKAALESVPLIWAPPKE